MPSVIGCPPDNLIAASKQEDETTMFSKGLDQCFLTLAKHYVWWSLFCAMLLCQAQTLSLLSLFQMPALPHLAWLGWGAGGGGAVHISDYTHSTLGFLYDLLYTLISLPRPDLATIATIWLLRSAS